jgi:hypothetical protein
METQPQRPANPWALTELPVNGRPSALLSSRHIGRPVLRVSLLDGRSNFRL